MKILSIETSCDETAIAVVKFSAKGGSAFGGKVLANALFSQAKLHEEFGGVYPNFAKREHQKNLVPLFLKIYKKMVPGFSESRASARDGSASGGKSQQPAHHSLRHQALAGGLKALLSREPELWKQFEKHILHLPKPK